MSQPLSGIIEIEFKTEEKTQEFVDSFSKEAVLKFNETEGEGDFDSVEREGKSVLVKCSPDAYQDTEWQLEMIRIYATMNYKNDLIEISADIFKRENLFYFDEEGILEE